MEDFEYKFHKLLVKMSSNQGVQIKIHPHPNYRAFLSTYRSQLEKNGIQFCTTDLEKNISSSTLLIAFASAVIRWSIDYGVRAINYDLFGYRYSDYSHYSSVIHAFTFKELEQTCTALQTGEPPSESGNSSYRTSNGRSTMQYELQDPYDIIEEII